MLCVQTHSHCYNSSTDNSFSAAQCYVCQRNSRVHLLIVCVCGGGIYVCIVGVSLRRVFNSLHQVGDHILRADANLITAHSHSITEVKHIHRLCGAIVVYEMNTKGVANICVGGMPCHEE